MDKTKRFVFSFDERSFYNLEKIREQGRFDSLVETLRQSLEIVHALQGQEKQGFSEITVRNPETGEERILIIPRLVVAEEK